MAKDLRIRLELDGFLEGIVYDTEDQNVQLRIGKTTLQLSKWYAVFEEEDDGTNSLQHQGWQVNKLDNGKLALDFVIYSGDAKQIDFRQLYKAAFVGSLSLNSQGSENSVEVTEDLGLINARSLSQEEEMILSLPLKPIRRKALGKLYRSCFARS